MGDSNPRYPDRQSGAIGHYANTPKIWVPTNRRRIERLPPLKGGTQPIELSTSVPKIKKARKPRAFSPTTS